MARISFIKCDGGCNQIVPREQADEEWFKVQVTAPHKVGGKSLNYCKACGETMSLNLARLPYVSRERKETEVK